LNIATELRAGQTELLPDKIQERYPRLDFNVALKAVNF
jgi:hypothetical protein